VAPIDTATLAAAGPRPTTGSIAGPTANPERQVRFPLAGSGPFRQDARVIGDEEACYRAIASRDRRFDGWFFMGVTTTGIFCRPSCPATTPKRTNVRYFRSAAAAQGSGFRACRRCRPDTAPGSPEWNQRGDLAGRAVALIDDGVVDRDGVGAVARRLAVSERHLHRILVAELGASALSLARARRAQSARTLIETTDLPFTQIAFAAGFASVRQFNDTVRAYFGTSPSVLRADRRSSRQRHRCGARSGPDDVEPNALTVIGLRLPTRTPFSGSTLLEFLAARAIGGMEAVSDDGAYWRTLRLPYGSATAALRAGDDHVAVSLTLRDGRDLGSAVARLRRLLDLDADPQAIDAALAQDEALGALVARTPGRRSPGTVDGTEALVRAIVGQQVSVAGARTVLGRLVDALGTDAPAVAGAPEGLGRCFPAPEAIIDAPETAFAMPRSRHRALVSCCAAIAGGKLDLSPGAERTDTRRQLLAVAGVGPWTTEYVAMRALGDPDAFLPTDLGVRRGLESLGLAGDPRSAAALAARWRPWRAYALHHLWAAAP
jgi:AraC family transcriptional regulator of adaptative response / DNA-3-methyladenine glycosylase II